MGVELAGCQGSGVVDVVAVGEGAAGEGGFAEDAPPAFLRVEPARADGDEGVVDTGMVLEPGQAGQTVVTGQVVGDDSELAGRIGVIAATDQSVASSRVAAAPAGG
jgi:hypothetical protein